MAPSLRYLTKLVKLFRFLGHAMKRSWRNTVEISQKNYMYFAEHNKVKRPIQWDDFLLKRCCFDDARETAMKMPLIVRKAAAVLELVPGGYS